jgi:hypothetical protein
MGIGFPSGSKVQAGKQLGEHVLGEREMAGSQPGGASVIARDDRLGERGTLPGRRRSGSRCRGRAWTILRMSDGPVNGLPVQAASGAEIVKPRSVR